MIPIRGDAPFLFQALDSLSKSTLKPSEILIVNDGISENRLNALKSINLGVNIRVIKNEGVGLVSALNTGLEEAKSDLIARLDSDDFVYKNRLEFQYKYLNSSPEILVVGSQVTYVDENNRILGKSSYPDGFVNDEAKFQSSCLIAHPSVMYRKNEILKIGGYREVAKIGSTSLCEDFDLWKRIAKHGKILNMTEELTFYRQHSGQLSNEFRYAQELATLYVESEAFDKNQMRLEFTELGVINFEDQIIASISSLSKDKVFRFRIYSKINRSNERFKVIKLLLGMFIIKLMNLSQKLH